MADRNYIEELRKRSTLGRGLAGTTSYVGQNDTGSSAIPPQQGSTTSSAAPPRVQDTAPQYQAPGSDLDLDIETIRRIREEFKPSTELTDRFTQLLDKQPQRGQVGLPRSILSGIVGLKDGYKGAKEVLDQPYNEATADWKNQIEPAYQAANMERQSNINERQVFGAALTGARQQQALREQTRIADEKQQLASQIYELKRLKQEGWQFNFDGPTIMKYTSPGGQLIDTGVPTNKISQLDMLILRSELGLNRDLIMENEARITRQMPTPDENLSENQMITRRQTALRGLMEHQDPRIAGLARKWIDQRNGQYVLKERPRITGTWFSDTQQDIDEYDELLRLINPNISQTPTTGATATTRVTPGSAAGGGRSRSTGPIMPDSPFSQGLNPAQGDSRAPITSGGTAGADGLRLSPEVAQQRDQNITLRRNAIAWLAQQVPPLQPTERNIKAYIDNLPKK